MSGVRPHLFNPVCLDSIILRMVTLRIREPVHGLIEDLDKGEGVPVLLKNGDNRHIAYAGTIAIDKARHLNAKWVG